MNCTQINKRNYNFYTYNVIYPLVFKINELYNTITWRLMLQYCVKAGDFFKMKSKYLVFLLCLTNNSMKIAHLL